MPHPHSPHARPSRRALAQRGDRRGSALLLVLMMLFRREGLIPESRTKALMKMPSRTEAESLGAESLEAEAESDAVEHSDAGADAKIPGHRSDRLARLPNDRHRPLTELGVVLPPL